MVQPAHLPGSCCFNGLPWFHFASKAVHIALAKPPLLSTQEHPLCAISDNS